MVKIYYLTKYYVALVTKKRLRFIRPPSKVYKLCTSYKFAVQFIVTTMPIQKYEKSFKFGILSTSYRVGLQEKLIKEFHDQQQQQKAEQQKKG